MAPTANDEAFHEIQLNGKQLVFLFMAGTVVCVVIFLCGVLVGRGVRGERVLEDPLAAASTPLAAASPDAPPVVAPPVAAAPSGAPATAGENLNYPKQLTSAAAPAEKLSEPPPTPPAETKKPERVPAAPARAADAPAPPAEAATPGFAIQLAALRQRDEADDIVKRLMGKGYPAYVIAPEEGAPAVFRVRVGNFKERREAATVAARLQKEEQFNPWIVR